VARAIVGATTTVVVSAAATLAGLDLDRDEPVSGALRFDLGRERERRDGEYGSEASGQHEPAFRGVIPVTPATQRLEPGFKTG
jgi:hypothetical protein